MDIWKCNQWKKYYKTRNLRSGLRFRFSKGVDPEVRRACIEFGKWLRRQYVFPIRIPVYIRELKTIRAMDGDMVSATFFAPYDKNVEPYIRVATGDYYDMLNARGKNNALASILASIAHELTHYYQWINDFELSQLEEEKQAEAHAKKIIRLYSKMRDEP